MNEEFLEFRRKIFELIFDEILRIFESDILCSKLFNIMHGAFIALENMKKNKHLKIDYSMDSLFGYLFFAAIFLTCKVRLLLVYHIIFYNKFNLQFNSLLIF